MTRGYEQLEEKLEGASLIRNVLIISKAQDDDFGVYNCTAENDFGHDFIAINLAKQSKSHLFFDLTLHSN